MGEVSSGCDLFSRLEIEIVEGNVTDRSVYAALVDQIFGAGAATFDVSIASSNSVIGALSHPTGFNEFKANFQSRLSRLASAIKRNPALGEEILVAVNNIATKEWDGAYAELSTLDYFFAHASTGPTEVELNQTVKAIATLASDMGHQYANHDMSFPQFGVVMDTKILSDKIGGILDGIFKDFRQAKGIVHLPILASYDADEDFAIFQSIRAGLLQELIDGVDVNTKPTRFSSKLVAHLSYEFAWHPGVMMGVSEYSAIDHAANHHRLLFGHAKKFSKVHPTVIVFVLFPWAGESALSFSLAKKEFFSELSRRFFEGYVGSSELAQRFNNKIQSTISASDVTRHLSGIIFLEDNAILAKRPDKINIDASFAWNPNALLPLQGSSLDSTLQRRGALRLS